MSDEERTPVVLHARPAPVVVRAGHGGHIAPWRTMPLSSPACGVRSATPIGGTLAPLGVRHAVPGPEVFTDDEQPTTSRATPSVVNRLIRNYLACSPENQRRIEALVLSLRTGVGE